MPVKGCEPMESRGMARIYSYREMMSFLVTAQPLEKLGPGAVTRMGAALLGISEGHSRRLWYGEVEITVELYARCLAFYSVCQYRRSRRYRRKVREAMYAGREIVDNLFVRWLSLGNRVEAVSVNVDGYPYYTLLIEDYARIAALAGIADTMEEEA